MAALLAVVGVELDTVVLTQLHAHACCTIPAYVHVDIIIAEEGSAWLGEMVTTGADIVGGCIIRSTAVAAEGDTGTKIPHAHLLAGYILTGARRWIEVVTYILVIYSDLRNIEIALY